jgi:hypothetical protein
MLTNADKKRNVSVFILVYFLALFLKKFEKDDIFGNGVSGKPPMKPQKRKIYQIY